VNNVLAKHGLIAYVLAYVKDERGSFSTITFAKVVKVINLFLAFIVSFQNVKG
jgi:hypothetical protein